MKVLHNLRDSLHDSHISLLLKKRIPKMGWHSVRKCSKIRLSLFATETLGNGMGAEVYNLRINRGKILTLNGWVSGYAIEASL